MDPEVMPMKRRTFMGALGAPFALGPMAIALRSNAASFASELGRHAGTPDELAGDEDYWSQVQAAFSVDRSMVMFNNGGVSPAPIAVQQALARHLDFANEGPSYKMWRVLEPQKEVVRQRLARHFGVDTEEIAITRNASEGLQICQQGFDLQRGDEVLCTDQDYPRMVTTFKQRERREGIVLVQFPIPVPAEDPAEIVRLYEERVTARTRLILVSHMINITGQILPVREVVAMARRYGIPVIVDGAHAFAHFAFDHADLDCDYYATSLHKWLFAPIGTGMLYVRRDKIAGLWPLMAATETQDTDIRKFEQIGTHPCPNFLAIADALTFNEAIGAERKAARLVYIRDRWAKRLVQHDRIRLNTSLKPGFACGIANVRIEGVEAPDLQQHLWQKHRIYTVAIGHEACTGLRVSPSVYSTLDEVDRFSEAMEDVLRNGLAT
ncbi:MAG: aminotransferase class V-fold PLP-dependent enzyme [Planctomycetota bacterium]|nr:MAG: aminotransferase class V-fold PLP-dependent enzyme [Planctomycetota bacterium]